MSKPTGYVVGDDGTMRAVYAGINQTQTDSVETGVVEPDLEAIAAVNGVDLGAIADLDAKLAEVGSDLATVAAAAGVTPRQVCAVVLLLAGLVPDEDGDGQGDGDDEDQVEVVDPPIGQNGPDPAGTQQAEPDYDSFSKKQLEDEVKLRNSERATDDADYIVVDAPGNKPDLVAALKADDAYADTDGD